LAQAVIYVANAPKSNATVCAIDAAMAEEDHPVPESLRDSHTSTSRAAGMGKGYFYSHMDYEKEQDFLPDSLRSTRFYEPIRPQERNWKDKAEPELPELSKMWQEWMVVHPEGGELPMDAWCMELKCSREALARAISKLAKGSFTIEKTLVVRPLA
jgi:putative ATPase